MPSLFITIDANEARSGIHELLSAQWQHVVVRPLRTGDFAISSTTCHVLIERKTTPDFLLSIRDGRLFSQARRLMCALCRSLIIHEGDPDDLERCVERGPLRGALIALTIGFGVPLLHTRDLQDTADTIRHIAAQETRRQGRRRPQRAARCAGGDHVASTEDDDSDPRRSRPFPSVSSRSTRAPSQEVLRVLAALPGVGPTRAASLAQHIGGLGDIARVGLRDLLTVPGIGAGTAARIHDAIHALKRDPS